MQEINENILIYLNSLMEHNFIEKIALCFADAPIFFIPLFLIIAWLYYTFKEKNNDAKKGLLFVFYSAVIAIIINLTIQSLVHLERPETVLEWVGKLLLSHIPDASFPSDHAWVSMAFLTALFLAWYRKIWYFFLIPAILMNLSRVIVWVHWPFDIVVWSIIWISSAFISFKLLSKCKYINNFNNLILKIMNFIKM